MDIKSNSSLELEEEVESESESEGEPKGRPGDKASMRIKLMNFRMETLMTIAWMRIACAALSGEMGEYW